MSAAPLSELLAAPGAPLVSRATPTSTAVSGDTVAALRLPVTQGDTLPLAWRLEQLDRLERLCAEGEDAVLAALAADLGKPPLEA